MEEFSRMQFPAPSLTPLQEEEERVQLVGRLSLVGATIAYSDPPMMAEESNSIGLGEESTEAPARAALHAQQQAVFYSTPAAVPPSAAEPTTLQDSGVYQAVRFIPKIPLSQEEAKAFALHQLQYNGMPSGQSYGLPPELPMQQQQLGPMAPQSHLPPVQSSALPIDINAAIAQLAASGVLNTATVPQQVHHQSFAPQYTAQPTGQHHHHQQQGHYLPYQQSEQPPRAPQQRLPPGMRSMLGLHRPNSVQGGEQRGGLRRPGSTICRFYNSPGVSF
jgi:hypothetical protein